MPTKTEATGNIMKKDSPIMAATAASENQPAPISMPNGKDQLAGISQPINSTKPMVSPISNATVSSSARDSTLRKRRSPELAQRLEEIAEDHSEIQATLRERSGLGRSCGSEGQLPTTMKPAIVSPSASPSSRTRNVLSVETGPLCHVAAQPRARALFTTPKHTLPAE